MGLLPKQIELGNLYKAILNNEPYEVGTYKLAETQLNVLKWNAVRNNVGYDAQAELDMYQSEALEEEVAEDTYVVIDSLADRAVVMIGTLAKSGMHGEELTPELLELLEEYKTIPKRVKEMGFCFRKVMGETLAEINSRVQDPEQARIWAEEGASGKWQKSLLPEDIAKTYKADYSKAIECQTC